MVALATGDTQRYVCPQRRQEVEIGAIRIAIKLQAEIINERVCVSVTVSVRGKLAGDLVKIEILPVRKSQANLLNKICFKFKTDPRLDQVATENIGKA